MYNIHRSGGPAVWRDKDGAYSGACARKYSGGMIVCVEYCNGVCNDDRKNPRAVPDSGATAPDWCPYLDGMIRDAQMGDAFRKVGLSAEKKKDALTVIRAMPKEHRPKGARDLGIMQLHNAIRRAWDAGWRMEDMV